MNSELIVQKGHPALAVPSKNVAIELITGPTIKQEIETMKRALYLEQGAGGVALAAPQVGISRRMFIISGAVFGEQQQDQVFINPCYTKQSKKTHLLDEGCLSVRYCYGKVRRHTNVSVEYYNEHGSLQKRGAGGFLAHIIQHEMDHLDGILFVDKAESVEELKGQDRKELDRCRQMHINSLNE